MIYELYDRIKILRQQASLSQVELAKKLGISKSAVNSWEMSTSSPSLIYIAKLSHIFGVSTDYILGVNNRLTIDITNLDEFQQQAVLHVVRTFERDNAEKIKKA